MDVRPRAARPARSRTLQRRGTAAEARGAARDERDAGGGGRQPHRVPDGLRKRLVVGRVPLRAARPRRRRVRHRRRLGIWRSLALPRGAPQRSRRARDVARRGWPPHPLRHRGRPAVGLRQGQARCSRHRRQGHALVLLLLRGGSARRRAGSKRRARPASGARAPQARAGEPAFKRQRGAARAQHHQARVQAIREDAK